MPIGVIVNALAIAVGGLIGAAAGGRLSDEFKDKMNMIFGVCSMGMGVSSIALMENMPAVILSLLLGTTLGIILHLGRHIENAGARLQGALARALKTPSEEAADQADKTAQLVTVVVLFCTSGTGIYGAMISGMSGDHSILIAKAILDLFTSLIFACSLGAVVSLIALPQLAIFLTLFAGARLIFPLTTPSMINDFKACGGFLMLATGFRIARIKMFPTADMIPSMILVMPLSWLWAAHIMPLFV